MCTTTMLSMRQLMNCLRLCGTKFHRLNITYGQPSCKASYQLGCVRRMCSPLSHCSLWLHPQQKLAWQQSASHSTVSEPATAESALRPNRSTPATLRSGRVKQQTWLREMIQKKVNTTWTDDDWMQVADSLSSAGQESWQVVCMHTLYVDKNIQAARSLMAYLEREGNVADLITVTFYLGLLGETNSPDALHDDEIYKYYHHLLSRSPVLDAASIEVLISALSMTRYYQECLQLLETCRETSNPNPSSMFKILRAGLRYHDKHIFQTIVTEIDQLADPFGLTAFVPKVVEECLAVNNLEGLEMFMNFVQKHKLLLKRSSLEEVVDIFHKYQPNRWTANYGYIRHQSGQCSVCGHQMKRSEVSDSDFQSIQATFLDQVIIGNNVFFKSSPEEVSSFVGFMEKMGSFDIVIDGLNMLYYKSQKPNLEQLEKAVEYFTSQGNKVLILGNRMMSAYSHRFKKFIPKPVIYMTNTTKADDAFFLYAALRSGKHTLVVSRDKLRDHKYLLKPVLRPIFQQWLLSAQVYNWFISRTQQFTIGKRHLYITGPAKDQGGWHIPENDVTAVNPFGKLSVLCLRNETGLRDQELRQTFSPRPRGNKEYQKNVTSQSRGKTLEMRGPRVTAKKSNHLTAARNGQDWFDG